MTDQAKGGEAGGGARRGATLAAAMAVALLALVAFLPALNNGFVNWDDAENFLKNPGFRGLGWEQLAWAWQTRLAGVFQPFAWWLLSFQYSWFELDPRGYHAVSLLIHAANTGLLFVLCLRISARARPEEYALHSTPFAAGAALACGLFAVHPLRTEAVAWVSCQPYLPCVLFLLLATLAYLTERRILALPLFAFALLFKAAAVSFPFLLLALDWFPLRRIGQGPDGWFGPAARKVWIEKVPYFLLAAVIAWVAFRSRDRAHFLVPLQGENALLRTLEAGRSVWKYLLLAIAPFLISPLYPDPDPSPAVLALGTVGVLAVGVLSALLWRWRRSWPGVLAIWAAYLVILMPNLGLIRVGPIQMADRYTYLADIPWTLGGAVLLGGWLAGRHRGGARMLGGGTAILLALLISASWSQCRVWSNSEAFWRYVQSRVGDRNEIVSNAFGSIFIEQGWYPQAIVELEKAVRIKPDFLEAQNNLGVALVRSGRIDEAIPHYLAALEVDRTVPAPLMNLGIALARQRKFPEAIARFRQALEINPEIIEPRIHLAAALAETGKLADAIEALRATRPPLAPDEAEGRHAIGNTYVAQGKDTQSVAQFWPALRLRPDRADYHVDLGIALLRMGGIAEAVSLFTLATRLDPKSVEARNDLGTALGMQNRLDEAIARFKEALRIRPGFSPARNNLGMALARQRKYDQAIAEYRKLLKADPDFNGVRGNLGAALVETGRYDEAIPEFNRALEANPRDPEAHFNLAVALSKRGRDAEATGQYREALRLRPGDSRIQAALDRSRR